MGSGGSEALPSTKGRIRSASVAALHALQSPVIAASYSSWSEGLPKVNLWICCTPTQVCWAKPRGQQINTGLVVRAMSRSECSTWGRGPQFVVGGRAFGSICCAISIVRKELLTLHLQPDKFAYTGFRAAKRQPGKSLPRPSPLAQPRHFDFRDSSPLSTGLGQIVFPSSDPLVVFNSPLPIITNWGIAMSVAELRWAASRTT